MRNITALSAIIFMLLTAPFDWSNYFLLTISTYYKCFFILYSIILLVYHRAELKISLSIFVLLLIQFSVFILLMFFDGVITHINTSITFFVIGAFSIFIDSKLINIAFFIKIFLSLMVLICCSVLISVAFAYFGLIGVLELTSNTFLVGLSLSKDVIINTGDRIIFRPGGVFTEPGMLSTFLIFSIFLNHVTKKRKYLNILFIITGLSSLSLLFILFIPFYLLVTSEIKKFMIITTILLAAILLILEYLDPSLKAAVVSRMYNGGSFSISNNRATLIEEGIRNIDKIKLVGSSFSQINSISDLDATWIGFFIRYGWFAGFFLFLHNFLIFDYKRINISQIFIFLIICILFYQRPFIISFSYYMFILLIRSYFLNRRAFTH
jgi:hypothetical protein